MVSFCLHHQGQEHQRTTWDMRNACVHRANTSKPMLIYVAHEGPHHLCRCVILCKQQVKLLRQLYVGLTDCEQLMLQLLTTSCMPLQVLIPALDFVEELAQLRFSGCLLAQSLPHSTRRDGRMKQMSASLTVMSGQLTHLRQIGRMDIVLGHGVTLLLLNEGFEGLHLLGLPPNDCCQGLLPFYESCCAIPLPAAYQISRQEAPFGLGHAEQQVTIDLEVWQSACPSPTQSRALLCS